MEETMEENMSGNVNKSPADIPSDNEFSFVIFKMKI